MMKVEKKVILGCETRRHNRGRKRRWAAGEFGVPACRMEVSTYPLTSLRSALTTSFTPRFTCLCLEAEGLGWMGFGVGQWWAMGGLKNSGIGDECASWEELVEVPRFPATTRDTKT